MQSPSQRPFDDPAADAAVLLIRLGLVVLAFAVPLSAVVFRRAPVSALSGRHWPAAGRRDPAATPASAEPSAPRRAFAGRPRRPRLAGLERPVLAVDSVPVRRGAAMGPGSRHVDPGRADGGAASRAHQDLQSLPVSAGPGRGGRGDIHRRPCRARDPGSFPGLGFDAGTGRHQPGDAGLAGDVRPSDPRALGRGRVARRRHGTCRHGGLDIDRARCPGAGRGRIRSRDSESSPGGARARAYHCDLDPCRACRAAGVRTHHGRARRRARGQAAGAERHRPGPACLGRARYAGAAAAV